MTVRLILCATCPGAPAAALRRALAEGAFAGHEVALEETACMNTCGRGPALAIRAEGRMTCLFGGVTGADLPGLAAFLHLYMAAPEGRITDARPLGGLRFRLIARIPG